MRHKALRTLVLAGALLALSLPAVSVTHNASACSNPDCTLVTGPIPGTIDGYVSPINVSDSTITFAEFPTTAQRTTVTTTGVLAFTINDLRGNNQGFVANVSSNGLASSLFPVDPIPGTAITVAATPTVDLTCWGPILPPPFTEDDACAPVLGLGSAVGATLKSNPAVAAQCPQASIGEASYPIEVPLNLSVGGTVAEKLGSYPASWFGTFTVSVTEGQAVDSFTSYTGDFGSCPAFGFPVPGQTSALTEGPGGGA